MRRRSRQRPRLGRHAVFGACAVLAAAALAQASEGDRPAKSEAGAAAPPSNEALQMVASAGSVERRPAPRNSRQIAPANAGPAGSPTGTRIVVAAHQRAVPKPTITLRDAAAIVRQSYGGNVVHSAAAPQPAAEAVEGARYRIRVDVDGRVKSVLVDQTGRILQPPQALSGKALGAGPSQERALSGGRSPASGARGAGPSQNDNASTDH